MTQPNSSQTYNLFRVLWCYIMFLIESALSTSSEKLHPQSCLWFCLIIYYQLHRMCLWHLDLSFYLTRLSFGRTETWLDPAFSNSMTLMYSFPVMSRNKEAGLIIIPLLFSFRVRGEQIIYQSTDQSPSDNYPPVHTTMRVDKD